MNPVTATAILVVAGCLVLAASSLRVVAVGTCAVVTRFGRVTRVLPPGLVVVLPLVDRTTRVTLTPRRAEPPPTAAHTRDGFAVRLTASVLWQVHDAAATLDASPDVQTVTEDAVERWLRHLVAGHDLAVLLDERAALLAGGREELLRRTAPFGVTVLDVDVLELELRAGPEILRLLR